MKKKKMIIQVPMHCKRCMSKAMKTAAVEGVTSVRIISEDDQLEIIGDGVDPVSLTTSLRKKLKYAKIVRVEQVEEDIPEPSQEENPDDEDEIEEVQSHQNQSTVQWQCPSDYAYPQRHDHHYYYINRNDYDPNPPVCSIL